MSNNFIKFNQNKKNMMNDSSYSTHTKVLNGVLGGNDVVADPQIHKYPILSNGVWGMYISLRSI